MRTYIVVVTVNNNRMTDWRRYRIDKGKLSQQISWIFMIFFIAGDEGKVGAKLIHNFPLPHIDRQVHGQCAICILFIKLVYNNTLQIIDNFSLVSYYPRLSPSLSLWLAWSWTCGWSDHLLLNHHFHLTVFFLNHCPGPEVVTGWSDHPTVLVIN